MNNLFSETLRKLREEKGLAQTELAKKLFVNHSTITRWESGTRLPDATMIVRLADCLGTDSNMLFSLAANSEESPNIIIVDDSKPVVTEGLNVLSKIMPNATITGFIWPREAIEYARANRVALALLDIELGTASGFDPAGATEPGIALENIRQRLDMMCRGSMTIRPREGGGTVVTVVIPDTTESKEGHSSYEK